jgi:hypothetical protein
MLSDFRGKVVVFAFWSDWDDSLSHRAFLRDAQLAPEMKGRPFVLLGFSHKVADRPIFSLAFARPDGSETVHVDGPIRERLGVRRFPATIVIDADGVLCLQCGDSLLLGGGYLRSLVAETEAKSARVQLRGSKGR